MLAAGCLVVAGAGLVTACNEHPVELANTDGIVDIFPEPPATEPEKVDILWVIDNSGSMCQEQEALRDEFDSFIEEFTARNIDFHIGVTTTQMRMFNQDVVALPGRLQSTPQPIPGSYQGCSGDEGDPSIPTDGYEPIRKNIEAAIACTKDPSRWQSLLEVDDDTIACALDTRDCATTIKSLFPTATNGESPYRDIPKVLRASDSRYQGEDGLIDRQKLMDDFACMSFVGTSGWAIEKGLSAVNLAVSPEMTGGTVENPVDAEAPNHGLLRENAQFAAIFLTDENDCSHDGSLDECSDLNCALANHPKFADESPLIAPDALAAELVANVAGSKGVEPDDFDPRNIVVASLHANSKRYGATANYPEADPSTFQLCEQPPESLKKEPSCSNPETFGTAYSGDRYEAFLRSFDGDRIYPKPQGEFMPGLVCNPDEFSGHMKGIATTIVGAVEQCITQMPVSCQGPSDTSCPSFPFDAGAGQCSQFGRVDQYFCDNAIQVRMYPKERSFADLQDHEYCLADSIDSQMAPNGCVVDPNVYGFEPCSARDEGVTIKWNEARWFERLQGFRLEVVVSAGNLTRR
ncbi:hypothetical protein FIV42_12370 [Persicimonas caeni]|uniref:VWA domain-containing protein n=1 Tax=Persicimonas caeni TaxID=2292766 RepID=A0A4Y6PTD4_PERCE|nr:hypothetical protein [Persicimonas caeni]QDG51510.1 hypothetical protein FIV42_12370 [Persicimonas caeni]QED32731.1 hypothetical protein FRD00_12365 [Persicimonas caeni]